MPISVSDEGYGLPVQYGKPISLSISWWTLAPNELDHPDFDFDDLGSELNSHLTSLLRETEIVSFSVEVLEACQPSDDRNKVFEIFKNNWKREEEECGTRTVEEKIQRFEKELYSNRSDLSFFILKGNKPTGSEIEAFVAFRRLSDETVYVQDFNCRHGLHGRHIGLLFGLHVANHFQEKGMALEGSSFPRSPICSHYIEDYHYVAFGFKYRRDRETGEILEPRLRLKLDKEGNRQYEDKKKKSAEIIEEYDPKEQERVEQVVSGGRGPVQHHCILKYDLDPEPSYERFERIAKVLFDSEFVLVRMIREKGGSGYTGQTYFAFERTEF